MIECEYPKYVYHILIILLIVFSLFGDRYG